MSDSSVKDIYEKYYDEESEFRAFYAAEASFYNDAVTQPMRLLSQFFKSGAVKGDLLIQYGGANSLAMLLPASGHFKEIIVTEFLESRLESFKKWLEKDPGAHDHSNTVNMICELEGDSGNKTEKEATTRKCIKEVLKAELTATHPKAPNREIQADCLLSSFSTELLSSDSNGYRAALKSMSPLVKPGGYLIMNVLLGCSFAMNGNRMLPVLSLTEEFVKEVVAEAGFEIFEYYVTPRTNNTLHDKINFSSVMLLMSKKVSNVD